MATFSVIAGQLHHSNRSLIFFKAKLCRQIIAELRGLAGIEIRHLSLIELRTIGENKNFIRILSILGGDNKIALLKLLFVISAQGQKCYFFEITVVSEN